MKVHAVIPAKAGTWAAFLDSGQKHAGMTMGRSEGLSLFGVAAQHIHDRSRE